MAFSDYMNFIRVLQTRLKKRWIEQGGGGLELIPRVTDEVISWSISVHNLEHSAEFFGAPVFFKYIFFIAY